MSLISPMTVGGSSGSGLPRDEHGREIQSDNAGNPVGAERAPDAARNLDGADSASTTARNLVGADSAPETAQVSGNPPRKMVRLARKRIPIVDPTVGLQPEPVLDEVDLQRAR